eukprot:CAMPEP_0114597450 /NCGR_PEP_ID=MMETSP0125-20121206/19733_1 /TAXON_ID=485358 ORGANISM="Aristerostoma sp., Strain ATCC 50986" /NCGR_SAMPLE_ID=MMETSP0125 /ASSEMBLY_ACC=CAM_ASM_000245 /LENGTH=128 /DNA_ID=CAMNT_0001802019 /DNA_START=1654 /DNA_END=2037 /DNA_ORIENTATION=-
MNKKPGGGGMGFNPKKPMMISNMPFYFTNRKVSIPELPKGRFMKLIIYSTWGDNHYLGLNGIEFFDERGEKVMIRDVKMQVRANPADINCLPGYGKDPMWLAPFTKGNEHTIDIDFQTPTSFSMIRFW